MVTKKRLFLGLMVLMVISIVPSFALAENKVTIQYAFWGNPAAIGVEKDIIDEFEKAYPNIKVDPVAVAYNDYHSKLLTLIAGGQAPDVMRIDSYYFADFMNAHALKDISGLIKKDKIDLSTYYPAGLLDCVYKGKYYGLPVITAPIYVYINVKMFKEAGIPVPSMDWKYDEFLKIAKQFSKGEGVNHTYGFGFQLVDISTILPFVWMNGGDLFDKSRKEYTLDRPESVSKIQEVADLIKQGVFADPAQFTTPDILNRWMVNDKVAMRMAAAAEILSLQKMDGFEFEVLPFPGTEKYPKATIYKSNVVGISASSKKQQAAWEFLKFSRGPGQPGELLYVKAKRMPPTFDDPELWKIYADPNKSPKMVAPVTQAIAQKYGKLLPLRSGWIEVQSLILPQIQRVFTGQATAEQALREIRPKVQEVLNRNK